MTCYAMRRAKWFSLVEEFPDMTTSLKKHIVEQYDRDIRQPLLNYKVQDFSILEGRADYTNVVAIQDLGDDQL